MGIKTKELLLTARRANYLPKWAIMDSIKGVADPELQLILELRYLNYMSWEQIAAELGFGIDNVFRLQRKALESLEIPESIQ